MTDQPAQTPAVLFREEGRAGFITLNRPDTLNALTHDMIKSLEPQYIKWAAAARIYGVVLEAAPGRAFCCGGDVRAIVAAVAADPAAAMAFFRDEYQQNWSLERFTKPNVALIDGMVIGAGIGISIFGTHRVAGENYSFSVPETRIGLFPDVGIGYVLGRLPGEMGVYLGLTGHAIGRADAYCLGLVTHCVDATGFDGIRHAMIEGDPIDTYLDRVHRDPGESRLSRLQNLVDRIFSAPTVEEILSRLDAEQGEHTEWARESAAEIRRNAPLSLKVALHQIRETRRMQLLKEALVADFRLTAHLVTAPDFKEGVRAALIDKDRAPRWQPQTLAEVTDAMVDACFAPLGEAELQLADRWTLVV